MRWLVLVQAGWCLIPVYRLAIAIPARDWAEVALFVPVLAVALGFTGLAYMDWWRDE